MVKQLTKKELMWAKIFYLVVGVWGIISGYALLHMPDEVKAVWIFEDGFWISWGWFALIGGIVFIIGFLVLQFGKGEKE